MGVGQWPRRTASHHAPLRVGVTSSSRCWTETDGVAGRRIAWGAQHGRSHPHKVYLAHVLSDVHARSEAPLFPVDAAIRSMPFIMTLGLGVERPAARKCDRPTQIRRAFGHRRRCQGCRLLTKRLRETVMVISERRASSDAGVVDGLVRGAWLRRMASDGLPPWTRCHSPMLTPRSTDPRDWCPLPGGSGRPA